MEDLRRYLEEIVEPTVKDFSEHPTSVRHAFLACVVAFHAVDYMAHPEDSATLRQKWGRQSEAFRRVDQFANSFKHVKNRIDRGKTTLDARAVISRPPAFAGVMRSGSMLGDKSGAVTLQGDRTVNLLATVLETVAFLRAQIDGGPGQAWR